MKIIKRLAFVLGMLVGVVSVGMGETESNKIDNKIKEFCGDSGISKCISFYETSCDSGNFWACGILSESLGALDMGDYDIKIDEMICKNYNGSTADIEKIILNLIKYAKEIGKFLAENNVAKTSSAMQEMARIVAQENLFIETAKTLEGQTEFKEKTIHRCMLIGNTYLWGFGIKQNINKDLHYLKKSCNYGYDTACNSLGNIYQGKDEVMKYFYQNYSNLIPNDKPLAKKYYEKACDLGHKVSCDEYIKLHQKGVK